MKPVFKIKRLGAQDRTPCYDQFITSEILTDICKRVTGFSDFEVQWIENRNRGRLIILETKDCVNYITLSQYGNIVGRNYQIQSVPTALGLYLKESLENKKKSLFWFYFLPSNGNNNTEYMIFFYRIMSTIGIKFLNDDYLANEIIFKPFSSVREIISERNKLKNKNHGNNSTYITDEGDFYHIYGKTFGANKKETILFCLAISTLTDKPIRLFQIMDNNSNSIGKKNVETIRNFVRFKQTQYVDILNDSFEFSKKDSKDNNNLRNPKFIYNLLEKYEGEKKCALCGCKIGSIVQAAHIYPVSEIRKREDLSDIKKKELSIDADNGIWLCENHHKLFDKGLIWFQDGKLCISEEIDTDDLFFIKKITTIDAIDPKFINERMLAFFDIRYGLSPRVKL